MINAKEIGGLAEARFAVEALARGFAVCRPFIDNRKYDLILEKQGCFSRVQIKSTSVPIARDGSFKLCVAHGSKSKKSYCASDIDVVACYIHTLAVFYIIPVYLIKDLKRVTLYPLKSSSKYDAFKNNWSF